MQFIGRYYHALEQKGRLSIPIDFRKALGKSAILTIGLEGCLFLMSQQNWQQQTSQFTHLPLTHKAVREWTRLLAHNASKVSFDKLGRIRLPDHLINAAKLEKRVVIAGSIQYVEIWDQVLYHTHTDDITNRSADIALAISTLSQTNRE